MLNRLLFPLELNDNLPFPWLRRQNFLASVPNPFISFLFSFPPLEIRVSTFATVSLPQTDPSSICMTSTFPLFTFPPPCCNCTGENGRETCFLLLFSGRLACTRLYSFSYHNFLLFLKDYFLFFGVFPSHLIKNPFSPFYPPIWLIIPRSFSQNIIKWIPLIVFIFFF